MELQPLEGDNYCTALLHFGSSLKKLTFSRECGLPNKGIPCNIVTRRFCGQTFLLAASAALSPGKKWRGRLLEFGFLAGYATRHELSSIEQTA